MVHYFYITHILDMTLEKRNSLAFPLLQPLLVGGNKINGYLGQRLPARILGIHMHFKRLLKLSTIFQLNSFRWLLFCVPIDWWRFNNVLAVFFSTLCASNGGLGAREDMFPIPKEDCMGLKINPRKVQRFKQFEKSLWLHDSFLSSFNVFTQ